MRKLAFWFFLIDLTFGCAGTYHSGRTGKYQPFYAVSVQFYKEDASADSASHRFVLEAKRGNNSVPFIITQCDRGNSNSESVECFFITSNPEMSFDILQVWDSSDGQQDSQDSDNLRHKGKNVANSYLCGNMRVGMSANEIRRNNDGSLDPEYTFNLPSDRSDPSCRFRITDRTMRDAMTVADKK